MIKFNEIKNDDFTILELLVESATIGELKVFIPPVLDKNKGLVLSGRMPIWLGQFLLNYYSSKVKWVAQFDPRFGAVVLISNNINEKRVFEIIQIDELYQERKNTRIIAVIGPSHSGKSIFTYELFLQSLKSDFNFANNNMFVIKAAPDGEGLWTRECDKNYVKFLRIKGKFSNGYTSSILRNIDEISKIKQVVFVDLGGKMTSENKEILLKCSHAIVVIAQNKINEYELWKNFLIESNPSIQILAKIKTHLSENNRKPQIRKLKNGVYKIQLWNVSRENENIEIPKIFINQITNRRKR
ncbi:MAG: hypothetical protein COW71_06450 [Ignavibacteriales bacterium CG18_big_fil_WC_8_21_14_2_50_31_20]|nr:MAG: hypothetical protein COW71_06450 [Ignavibacteriales bacterium CG18_big_fil_WC_8_21_14_2_50_31_20]